MTEYSYESYGERARLLDDPTLASGRLLMREDASRRIVHDVLHKLDLRPTDELLDIGCGIGQLGIPLSFLVKTYTGIDHPDAVKRFRERLPKEPGVTLVGGKFPQDLPDGRFDKVLVYDVVHYFSRAELTLMLDVVGKRLRSPGRVLFGNVPNLGLKSRFYASAAGRAYLEEWQGAFEAYREPEVAALLQLDHRGPDPDLETFNDGRVLEIVNAYRHAGYHAFIVPQDWRLPMGVEREDVIVELP